mmetsp:Transcript_911/g.2836  ORF Transcript_911/g.2836 Transcript_911/m.2836 type:complete len:226 (-) Transcript_911:33-710(-)
MRFPPTKPSPRSVLFRKARAWCPSSRPPLRWSRSARLGRAPRPMPHLWPRSTRQVRWSWAPMRGPRSAASATCTRCSASSRRAQTPRSTEPATRSLTTRWCRTRRSSTPTLTSKSPRIAPAGRPTPPSAAQRPTARIARAAGRAGRSGRPNAPGRALALRCSSGRRSSRRRAAPAPSRASGALRPSSTRLPAASSSATTPIPTPPARPARARVAIRQSPWTRTPP